MKVKNLVNVPIRSARDNRILEKVSGNLAHARACLQRYDGGAYLHLIAGVPYRPKSRTGYLAGRRKGYKVRK